MLWIYWWDAIIYLRPACARTRTFMWFAVCVAGLTVRTERMGVTSIVRALGLQGRFYDNLLDNFHSTGIKLDSMTVLWSQLVLRLFPGLVRVNGRLVLVGDGIKVSKQGKKMPAVKLLHQESESNTKAEYIMGHSFQAVSILSRAANSVFAVPLAARIHEGNHLVTRARSNAVAYQLHHQQQPKKRGRPRKYGDKVKPRSLFGLVALMEEAQSPVYGEKNVAIRYAVHDLLWRPTGSIVRFVIVVHPTRGRCILMSTDTSLSALDIIHLYGLRFKIEHAFKQAVHVIGSFSYHFWMSVMKPLERRNGNQHLHRESKKYRDGVKRKLKAYHVFVHAGIVAQGLLHYLASCHTRLVWNSFGSWLRTIRPGLAPSELVVATALRSSLPHFLLDTDSRTNFAKFITQRQDLDRMALFRLVS